MARTLVVAEKPSVARDLASTLPGSFKQSKDKTHLEGEDYTVTWAVGHLVGLAPPDEYDPKLKKWRFADLPILPDEFKLIPNDERAGKQLRAIHRLMADDDVDLIVNACDAGREGELIFAYVYDLAPVQKPVQRLWLSSMTKAAIREAFEQLRPADELKSLEEAARSRSEADWLVGMNATRAASVRLRAAFDGAVSLGRVQTPTLALVARREEEIRNFVPEPYWLVEARFEADAERRYTGRYLGGKRLPSEDEAQAVVDAVRDQAGEITKLDKSEQREQPQLLYDLTSLQRHANSLYGFSARRTLAAAQRLYEEHKALTYPRTNSRFLTGDMIAEIKPTAEQVGHHPPYQPAARFVLDLESLPLGRVVNDAKVQDHHAIIPTNSEHNLSKMGSDELKVYDLVAKRFLAIFHPEAVFERTRVETTVREQIFRTSGRRLIEAGWRSVYGELSEQDRSDDDSGGDQLLPRLEQGEGVQTRECEWMRKETQPPRRYSDASLLGAMETAGKEIDDAELREAMKDSGIGTPATRASIIERLVDVGYIERDGRALVATEKGIQVIRLLGEHKLTSPELTGNWERRLRLIEHGEDTRPAFMDDIKKFTTETVQELDKLKGVQIERAKLGPCPVCGREISENRKGYSCWSREDPGCGFVIWKKKAGKMLPVSVAKELIESLRVAREAGEEPGVGRTEKPVTGFRSRAGRTFRAKLRLEQTDEGKWRVEFDEEWAKEPPAGESEEERAEREAAAAGSDGDAAAESQAARAAPAA
ncbi:MAG TPA: DNA topoisomerase 3 [Thermoleophilaceae bacterium]|nr:DNA topoisomerase 3 [Thermoleophilaceae bacterium]